MESIKGHRGEKKHFYFVARTGEVTPEPPALSEFFVYRLKIECFEGVVAGLNACQVSRHGLEHHPDFIAWLNKQNTWRWAVGGPFAC